LPFNDRFAVVSVGGKQGYIDKSGRLIIEPQFDSADPFVHDLAAVVVDGKTG